MQISSSFFYSFPCIMSAFRQQLLTLSSGQVAHRDLGDRYRMILEEILKLRENELVDGLKLFIETIVNENVSLVISRQLLTEVSARLSQLKDDSVSKAVSHFTLDVVQPRVISFEDQVSINTFSPPGTCKVIFQYCH